MIDIDNYINAIRINWVKRFINNTDMEAYWKAIPKYYFNKYGSDFLIFNMNFDKFN